MISIILPYYNSLKQMRERTISYFDMINDYINHDKNLQLIISDYGSDDDILDVLKKYEKFNYVYTEPNEGEFFNISKCTNNALTLARNELIFTNGVDWVYNYDLLSMIMNTFIGNDNIIFEPPIVILKEDGEFEKFIYTNVMPKKLIIKAGGWDERIFNWGQEDHDLIDYVFNTNPVSIIRFTDKTNTIIHQWHDNKLYKIGRKKEGNEKNMEIKKENMNNNRKNMINSYWYNKDGVLKLKNK